MYFLKQSQIQYSFPKPNGPTYALLSHLQIKRKTALTVDLFGAISLNNGILVKSCKQCLDADVVKQSLIMHYVA